MTGDCEFPRLESQLRESWLMRGANLIGSRCAVSLEQSSSASSLRRMRSTWQSTPANVRVRATAAALAVATLGHLALLRFVPPHIAPAVPRMFWVLVAAAPLIVAALATQVTRAWSTSVAGNVWRVATGWLAPESRR